MRGKVRKDLDFRVVFALQTSEIDIFVYFGIKRGNLVFVYDSLFLKHRTSLVVRVDNRDRGPSEGVCRRWG